MTDGPLVAGICICRICAEIRGVKYLYLVCLASDEPVGFIVGPELGPEVGPDVGPEVPLGPVLVPWLTEPGPVVEVELADWRAGVGSYSH